MRVKSLVNLSASSSNLLFAFQYSQKEDKYEEEIKVLTDKLKEVRLILLTHEAPEASGAVDSCLTDVPVAVCVPG